ncbi:MAG: amidohydrolase [Desulfobacteraceae bacterium]|jgi:predicted TIM-barrel fold metal-dependent hydrolase|nr:MAG: amidohydrolase [Desulfobacteraceae bacterium]
MILDFHTHIFPKKMRDAREDLFSGERAFKTLYDSSNARLAGAEDLIAAMDQDGVERSVVFGFPWERQDNYRRHNDYILDSVKRFPDRLIGFCCFSPLSPGAARETERCLGQGLSGAGELAVYGSGLSARVLGCLSEVMAVCAGKNAPVLIHTNEPVGHKYPGKAPMGLGQIYRLIMAYPSQPIILAHWGGGIFFYSLMKKEVGEAMKNVWFDTAAAPFLYRNDIYRIASEIIGPEKILFGTDYPLLKARRYMTDISSADINQAARDAIMGENARALLGIIP